MIGFARMIFILHTSRRRTWAKLGFSEVRPHILRGGRPPDGRGGARKRDDQLPWCDCVSARL